MLWLLLVTVLLSEKHMRTDAYLAERDIGNIMSFLSSTKLDLTSTSGDGGELIRVFRWQYGRLCDMSLTSMSLLLFPHWRAVHAPVLRCSAAYISFFCSSPVSGCLPIFVMLWL